MKLLFSSNVYLIINSVFPIGCIGVLSLFPQGGEMVELIIFTIGAYWFNMISIIKSLMILMKHGR